jgi:NAD(P)-dependent dehydrogenase (short-subunit alcohol dehydrogenase family)
MAEARQRTVFISGAAAGIGRATAELFAQRGWRVGVYDIDGEGAARVAESLGSAAESGVLDVRDASAFAASVSGFVARSGGSLDVMLNNAGIVGFGDFTSMDVTRHRTIVDVNLGGVIHGALAAWPHLRSTAGSCMINLASASAYYGAPGLASYSATKFAVKGLTEALDIEWAPQGVRVMDVLPLFVSTAMVEVDAPPMSLRRLGVRLTAADVAQVIWRAAHWRAWPRTHWTVGWQTRVFALGLKLMPALLNRWTTRRLSGY